MSHTGVWIWSKQEQRMVRISDRIPNVSMNDHVSAVPEGGYFSENLNAYVETRSQKRRIMEKRGVREVESGERFTRPSEEAKRARRRKYFEEALP